MTTDFKEHYITDSSIQRFQPYVNTTISLSYYYNTLYVSTTVCGSVQARQSEKNVNVNVNPILNNPSTSLTFEYFFASDENVVRSGLFGSVRSIEMI